MYDKRVDFDFDLVNFPFLDGDVPRRSSYGVYISQIIRFARAFFQILTSALKINQKYNVSLKKLLQLGICNPEFYRDSEYKFKKIIGNPNFTDLFKRIVSRFKTAGYTLDIMRQAACLVFNPIMLNAMLHSLVAQQWFNPQTQ